MSNFVRTADFAAKDGLASGTALKALKGTELGLEFDNIATMSATKVDSASNASLLSLVLTGSTVPSNGIYLPAANTIGLATASTQRGTVNSTGNWALNAPSSGVTLTVNCLENVGVVLQGGTPTNGFRLTFADSSATRGFLGYGLSTVGGAALTDFGLTSNSALFLSAGGAARQFNITAGGICQVADSAGTLQPIGFKNIPTNVQTVNYTAVLVDEGKIIVSGSGGAVTFTIPSNASVPYENGATLTFACSQGAGVITIAINSDTLLFAGTALTGSRTLTNGMATAVKIAATQWIISGAGLA